MTMMLMMPSWSELLNAMIEAGGDDIDDDFDDWEDGDESSRQQQDGNSLHNTSFRSLHH